VETETEKWVYGLVTFHRRRTTLQCSKLQMKIFRSDANFAAHPIWINLHYSHFSEMAVSQLMHMYWGSFLAQSQCTHPVCLYVKLILHSRRPFQNTPEKM